MFPRGSSMPVPALVGLVVLLLLSTGCSEGPLPLRVGHNAWIGYEPLTLARQLGKLDPQQIEIVHFSSTTEVIRAYRNRVIDVAAVTLDEVLVLAGTNPRQHVFLVCDISQGADAIVARPEFGALRDLRGRRIAVETTALGAYVLARGLAQEGIDPREVTVVPLTAEAHEAAFSADHAEAVVTFDPHRSRLVAAGARQIFDSTRIPGEIVDVFITREEVMNERPRALAALARGWFQAVAHLGSQPADAHARIARHQGTSPEEVAVMLRGLQFADRDDNLRLLGPSADNLAATFRRLGQVMVEQHLLPAPVETDRLPTAVVVQAALP